MPVRTSVQHWVDKCADKCRRVFTSRSKHSGSSPSAVEEAVPEALLETQPLTTFDPFIHLPVELQIRALKLALNELKDRPQQSSDQKNLVEQSVEKKLPATFSSLPVEIQLIIFEYALPDPVVIEIGPTNRLKRLSTYKEYQAQPTKIAFGPDNTDCGLVDVCRLSREVFLKHYRQIGFYGKYDSSSRRRFYVQIIRGLFKKDQALKISWVDPSRDFITSHKQLYRLPAFDYLKRIFRDKEYVIDLQEIVEEAEKELAEEQGPSAQV